MVEVVEVMLEVVVVVVVIVVVVVVVVVVEVVVVDVPGPTHLLYGFHFTCHNSCIYHISKRHNSDHFLLAAP